MDYHAVHGHDVANFSTPLAHRVLTVSAADADASLLSQSSASSAGSRASPRPPAPRFVATGVPSLDALLAGMPQPQTRDGDGDGDGDGDTEPLPTPVHSPTARGGEATQRGGETAPGAARGLRASGGGVRRGQLTEIWGPPGAGKTAFGMQLVASALCGGGRAVWIDCFQPLCDERLAAVVDHQRACRAAAGADDDDDDGARSLDDGFTRYACPSLPHFIAMLCPPSPAQPPCIPSDATVLVVDGLSALVNAALPRTTEGKGAPLMANGKKGPAPYEKRTQVLQYIAAALERLAETRNIALVLLTQCASRMQGERGATLAPALNAYVWDRGIATRLVLFRDWAWKENRPVGGRFAGVQKLDGHSSNEGLAEIVAFDITETGLVEEHYTAVPPRASMYKRKLGDTELDGGTGDDDYGWDDEDDDDLPRMPPQWQGSEDILLGHRYEEGDDDDDEADSDGDGDNAAGPDGDAQRPREQLIGKARRSSQSVADSEEESDL